MSVLTHFPKNRLSELAGRFGGISREEAVAAATRELEVMRPEADKVILAAIAQLEKIVSAAIQRKDASAAVMKEMLPACDQIVTLAGTYGYSALDKAARSLCDLLGGLLREDKADMASIRVHVQTIRMIAPGGLVQGKDPVELLLFELAKVLEHHGYVRLEQEQDSEDASIGAAG
jgi:hypothetical protein